MGRVRVSIVCKALAVPTVQLIHGKQEIPYMRAQGTIFQTLLPSITFPWETRISRYQRDIRYCRLLFCTAERMLSYSPYASHKSIPED